MSPLFTIVTVTYNAAACVEKTITSVLSQTCSDFEYIIVDGGSTDGTVGIIKKYGDRIKWISEQDKGIYDGMNKAIAMASGKYLLFMNADDTFASETVLDDTATRISTLDSDIFYGSWRVQTEYGEYHQEPGKIEELKSKWVVCHQATFVRTALLKERPFDLRYRLCADFDMLSEFLLEGKSFRLLPMEIARVPIDSGASFKNFARSKREHYQIIATRGMDSRFKTELMIFRVGCVHFLKVVLPRPVRHCFFRFLAKHYKVM